MALPCTMPCMRKCECGDFWVYLEESERLHQPPHFILEGKDNGCSPFLRQVLLFGVLLDFSEGGFV